MSFKIWPFFFSFNFQLIAPSTLASLFKNIQVSIHDFITKKVYLINK